MFYLNCFKCLKNKRYIWSFICICSEANVIITWRVYSHFMFIHKLYMNWFICFKIYINVVKMYTHIPFCNLFLLMVWFLAAVPINSFIIWILVVIHIDIYQCMLILSSLILTLLVVMCDLWICPNVSFWWAFRFFLIYCCYQQGC